MKLRKATKEDWNILLDWRNDEFTRINSINSEIISETEHKKWYFNSLKNKNREIFLVEEEDDLVGTLRVDIENRKKIISWTVAPEHRGRGYAKIMVKMLADKLKGHLEAIVKETNIASIKVAEYAGFTRHEKQNGILIFKRINDENS